MIDVASLPMEQLLGLFGSVIAIMITAIWWMKRVESDGVAEAEHRLLEKQKVESIVDEVPPAPVQKENKSRKNDRWKDSKKEATTYVHPWSVTTLKGHTGAILDIDFAPDGKKFVSIGEDNNVILWHVKDFSEREHKSTRGVLDFDRATHVSFAPDSKSLVMSLKRENKLGVYVIQKREDTGNYKFVFADNADFPKAHNLDIAHIGIGSSGRYLFSACPEGKAVIYSLKGEVLSRLEPRLGSLLHATLSPDARFLSMCGFSPDAFVFEVAFSRTGEFLSAKKAFNLQGANSGIYATAFNQDASRAVTVSKDGLWRVYNTDIRYAQGEDAKVITSGGWAELRGASPEQVRLAISPSGGSFVVAIGPTVKFFCAEDGSLDFPSMAEVHPAPISRVRISACGRLVATAGDKYIRIFHNVPEYHADIARLKKSLPNATNDGSRRRIQEMIDESAEKLKALVGGSGN